MEGGTNAKRKRRRYTTQEKMEIVKMARSTSVKAASTRFVVGVSSIYEWMDRESALMELKPSVKRSPRSVSTPTPIPTHNTSPVDTAPHATVTSATEACSTTNAASPPANPSSPRPANTLARVDGIVPSITIDALVNSTVIGINIRLQSSTNRPMLLVGFQGEHGGFAEIAARGTLRELIGYSAMSGRETELTAYHTPVRMLEAIHNSEIEYAFMPSEVFHSSTFLVPLDRLVSLRLGIVGEVASDECVCICAFPGTNLSDADCVMTDIYLLARCEECILELESRFDVAILRQVVWDSATACRIVHEEEAANTLVLCSTEAAQANGLEILVERVETKCTISKYTVISRRGAAAMRLNTRRVGSIKRQSTLLLSAPGRVDLLDVLRAFAHLNLSIEHFSIRNHGDEPTRSGQSCLVSYQTTSDVAVEGALEQQLASAADTIVHLGNYFSYQIGNTLN